MNNPSSTTKDTTEQKSRKRSRPSKSKQKKASREKDQDALYQEQKQDYYNRLLHQCQKAFNKHVKALKKIEQLKLSKKVKTQQDDKNKKNNSSISSDDVELQLQAWKELSTDHIVHEGLRRLGILALNPKQQLQPQFQHEASLSEQEPDSVTAASAMDKDLSNSKKPEPHHETNTSKVDSSADDPSLKQQHETLVEKLLSHARLVELTEEWNEEITKYRQWCNRILVMETTQQHATSQSSKKKKRQKGNKDNNHDQEERDHVTFGQSVFYQLGGNNGNDMDPDDSDNNPQNDQGDGYDSDGQPIIPIVPTHKKKNRPGQRARQAKALAQEKGSTGSTSWNWRGGPSHQKGAPKQGTSTLSNKQNPRNANSNHSGQNLKTTHRKTDDSSRSIQHQKTTNRKMDDDGPLHPSWEARKAKTDGIVQFKGTKITFGDDD